MSGNVAEVLVYQDELSSTERQQVQSYLALKYGITLDPLLGTYINSAGNDVYDMANTETFNFTFGPTNNG